MIGSRLAHYDVTHHLGSGGFGDVYQATDTKLGRSVAIKLLPEAFARDAERVARFRREARVLASLNHSNIAAIYGFEESGGRSFLVMEFVPGETLAERIKRGPIPVEDALGIASQITDALEHAHEKTITHRDLKPANVKITPEGKVKVLDFGLAKAYAPDPADVNLSNSPTLSAMATQKGVILGTAAYMSPEQAKGREADRRADIFAFGAVLYEMLTGRPAFHGEDVAEILARVLEREPDWTLLPPDVPPSISKLLRVCLQKDLKKRRQTAADVRIDIEQALLDPAPRDDIRALPAVVTAPVATGSKRRGRLAWAVAGILFVVSAFLAVIHFREPAPDDRSIRFVVLPPENATFTTTPPAISPDGRRLAFTASGEGRTQLWVRSLDTVAAQPLPGTDGALLPFWSPDSRFIAFFADGKLKKVDASGGPPQTLSDAPVGRGGAWNRDGVIIFSPDATGPIHRVSSSGGMSTPVTAMDSPGNSSREISHRGASFLPDGVHFFFLVQGGDKPGIHVGSLETKDKTLLLRSAFAGAYSPPGYLLFVQEFSLMAQRFDIKNFQLSGEAFPIAESVGYIVASIANFSVSDNGVLAYLGGPGGETRELAWFDRAGKLLEQIGPPIPGLRDVALSPDEKRAAVVREGDIWVVDLVRGVPSRLTFNPVAEDRPLWSPDGTKIAFESDREGARVIYQKASSGAGNEEMVLKSSAVKEPTDWSRDGRFILYENVDPKNGPDLWVLPLFGDKKPQPFLQTPFSETIARFSPDGKWIAYQSNESGRGEVFVQSFPPSGGKWQVSTSGGFSPRWRGDGKELFYAASDRSIMSVEVKAGSTFEVGSTKALFAAPLEAANVENRYEVSADGQRFLFNTLSGDAASMPITVVVNWPAAVKNAP
jgi:serine/threonine protein kinase/Tol biopolymer transport system component